MKPAAHWRISMENQRILLFLFCIFLSIIVLYQQSRESAKKMLTKPVFYRQTLMTKRMQMDGETMGENTRISLEVQRNVIGTAETRELDTKNDFVDYEVLVLPEEDKSPRVALLYITMGEIHNEPIWKAFFEAAGRLQFRFDLSDRLDGSFTYDAQAEDSVSDNEVANSTSQSIWRSAQCNTEFEHIDDEIKRLLNETLDGVDVIAAQKLFQVYTYPTQEFDFPTTSIFFDTEMPNRVSLFDKVAASSFVRAEIELLWNALQDARNQRFVLVSEYCVPLYRPEMIYLSLLSDTKSRLNACQSDDPLRDIESYDSRMATEFFNDTHWRTSNPWFSLMRSHAELIVRDTRLFGGFDLYCNPHERLCDPTVHYIPSVLATHGQDDETDCFGSLTTAYWEGGDNEYPTSDVDVEGIHNDLFKRLKGDAWTCKYSEAQAATNAFFVDESERDHCVTYNNADLKPSTPRGVDDWVVKSGFHPMDQKCPLFARKFPKQAVKNALAVSLSCNGGELGFWC